MIHLFQMCELVADDVLGNFFRHLHELPVETDIFLARAGSSLSLLISDVQLLIGKSMLFCERFYLLGKVLFGVGLVSMYLFGFDAQIERSFYRFLLVVYKGFFER